MHNLLSVIAGIGFGLSLIIAIGPQNVFVLKQGLGRIHVGAVVAVCVLSDALLIGLGAGGMSAAIRTHATLIDVIRYGGAVFLATYGALALIRALKPSTFNLIEAAQSQSLAKAIFTCLAFTWLNPHVYLDTVLLLGSVANAPGRNTFAFAIGAIAASALWFTSLGYGARLLTPIFSKPAASRILDMLISVLMFTVGLMLVFG